MNWDEFLTKLLAVYEIWDDDPQPSWEEVLQWIENDRRDARDLIEVQEELRKFEECKDAYCIDKDEMVHTLPSTNESKPLVMRRVYHKEGE